jgi:hypothetical protein
MLVEKVEEAPMIRHKPFLVIVCECASPEMDDLRRGNVPHFPSRLLHPFAPISFFKVHEKRLIQDADTIDTLAADEHA